ncbi:hypothetical protein B0H13DRAFT_2529428 [Mycena leptocephala]|nr:hypothetical protein B0H13DRAFT_2529428 [Mycena leptocephala]
MSPPCPPCPCPAQRSPAARSSRPPCNPPCNPNVRPAPLSACAASVLALPRAWRPLIHRISWPCEHSLQSRHRCSTCALVPIHHDPSLHPCLQHMRTASPRPRRLLRLARLRPFYLSRHRRPHSTRPWYNDAHRSQQPRHPFLVAHPAAVATGGHPSSQGADARTLEDAAKLSHRTPRCPRDTNALHCACALSRSAPQFGLPCADAHPHAARRSMERVLRDPSGGDVFVPTLDSLSFLLCVSELDVVHEIKLA